METKKQQRIALSIIFFLSGFCFSSWASRIPTIKTFFTLNEVELGNLLMVLPISSLIGLPVSTWLVSRFNSRTPLLFSFIFYASALVVIGFAKTPLVLIGSVALFAFSMRILNIAMNTQAITLQKKFDKKINGSFHGLWSAGGIVGVGFASLLIKFKVSIENHLTLIFILSLVLVFGAYKFLLKNDRTSKGNKLIIGKPDPFIYYLGLLIFLAAICEGGMYDWSGVYFKEVLHEEVFTMGYLLFMVFMTFSRFYSDYLIERIGIEKTYILSALLVSFGIITALIFPYFWPSLIGFCVVGFGIATIFPITFTLAGTSNKYSPAMVISIITTYAILGMFLGPPLIGYLAHTFSLKISFIVFVFAGLMVIPISQLFFRYQKNQ